MKIPETYSGKELPKLEWNPEHNIVGTRIKVELH